MKRGASCLVCQPSLFFSFARREARVDMHESTCTEGGMFWRVGLLRPVQTSSPTCSLEGPSTLRGSRMRLTWEAGILGLVASRRKAWGLERDVWDGWGLGLPRGVGHCRRFMYLEDP